MKHKPNFLIVGAAKAGTTSLAYYLSQHPDIYIPETKEPRFFIKDIILALNNDDPLKDHLLRTSVLDEEKYSDLYNVSQKRRGDASVHYLNDHKEAIPQIKKHLGDVPIFIMIRNPISRLISNYNYTKRFNLDVSIDAAIENEAYKIANNFNSFWLLKKSGLYYHNIEAYKKHFTNVHIIVFEDFLKQPIKICQDVFNILNVNSDFSEINVENKNPSLEEVKIYKYTKVLFVFLGIKSILSINNIKKIKKRFFLKKPKTTISLKSMEMLKSFYELDINKLKENYKLDCSYWDKDFNS